MEKAVQKKRLDGKAKKTRSRESFFGKLREIADLWIANPAAARRAANEFSPPGDRDEYVSPYPRVEVAKRQSKNR